MAGQSTMRASRRAPAQLSRVLLAVVVAAACGAVLVLLARGTASASAGWLAVAAAVVGAALAARVAAEPLDEPEDGEEQAGRAGPGPTDLALVALPVALAIYLSFNAGGYFPGAQGLATFVLAVALAIRIALARAPLAGLGRGALAAGGALALLAAWTLLSGLWSDSWGRSILEFDRALLYLLAFLLFASVPRSSRRLRLLAQATAAGFVAICTVALITRLLPDVWPISPNLVEDRLSYPLTYWNALGLVAALGIVLSFHSTSSRQEPRVGSVLAAGALPLLAATLLLTFSRGAIVAVAVGLVAYVLVARSRALLGALVAAGPTSAVAVVAAYRADLLASNNPTSAAATSQGHNVALVVLACIVVAMILRVLMFPLDRRVARFHLPRRVRRPVVGGAWAAGAIVLVGVALALGAPHEINHQWDRFVHTTSVAKTGDARTRLTDPSSNHRVDQWKVGIRAYRTERLHGHGAATYEILWAQRRPDTFSVVDAHSLYVEALAELGIVGFVLVLAFVLSLLIRPLTRARGRNRSLYAGVFAVVLTWALHAGIDWDWETPAVTLPVIALGASALARSPRRGPLLKRAPVPLRAVVALAVVAAAVVPVLGTVSQHHLDEANAAADRGDCTAAEREAHKSLDAISSRGQPHQVLAYCLARTGSSRAAVGEMQRAVDADPNYWRYAYDLALMQAAAGEDGKASIRRAAALNPRDGLTQAVLRIFNRGSRSKSRAAARTLVGAKR